MLRRLLGTVCGAALLGCALAANASAATSGQFRFEGWAGPAVQVHYARAETPGEGQRVLVVLHGLRRNARDYRDDWLEMADRYNLLVLAPRFSEHDFPRSAGYNLGNIFDRHGRVRARDIWSFSAIEPLFDAAQQRFGLQQPGYFLFGHSAGAQFVQRYLLFTPDLRVLSAVAANAGWYTFPDPRSDWPYGVRGVRFSKQALTTALEQRLVVLLGCEDDDPVAPNLRTTKEARAQGAHRLARGRRFIAFGAALARAQGWPFAWRVATVAGVGHNHAGMARRAGAALFGEEALRDECPSA